MSQALLATYRIELIYSVSSVPHKMRSYAKFDSIVSGVPQVKDRTGSGVLAWTDAAQGKWDNCRHILNTGVPAATAEFQQLLGPLWVPLASATLTGAGLASAASVLASQLTLTLRDTAFKFIKVDVFEQHYTPPLKSTDGLSIGTDLHDMVLGHTGDTLPNFNDPFMWEVSRGNRFILATGASAGVSIWPNRKLARRRGL